MSSVSRGHIYTYRQQRERWEVASVGSRENRVSFVACTRGCGVTGARSRVLIQICRVGAGP